MNIPTNNIKINTQTLLLLIIVGFVVYNFFSSQDIKTNVESYENKIETLEEEIDTVVMVNNKIDIKLLSVDENINKLSQDIGIIDKNIQNFKQKTNEKINSVDSYTFNELEQFFTNRYD